MSAKSLASVAALLVAVAAASGADPALSAPASFQLVFNGRHTPALLHEGDFTTSASFCASGHAADTAIDEPSSTATRVFTCSGSGPTFIAKVRPLVGEHGGSGSWQIVDGTGSLAALRGKGTWTSVRLSGTSDDPATITFRSTWQGVTDFDTAAPAITVSKARAKKLRRPNGAFALSFRLAFDEPVGNVVSYELVVTDPRTGRELSKNGKTSTGNASLSLRMRPTKRTHVVRINVEATDAVGNTAHAARKLRVR